LHRDGSEFPIELTLADWVLDGSRCFTAIVRDISDRLTAEQAIKEKDSQLRQAVKMEAVGRVAGGIAHDFNNLLTAIGGYAKLLLGRAANDEVVTRYARQIDKATKLATDLTTQLLAFSRKQVLAPKILDLNKTILETLPLLESLMGSSAVFVATNLGDDLGSVLVDPSQLQQVIMNLAVNARDAMPNGGTFSFRTRRMWVNEFMARSLHGFQAGDFIRLDVSDTGCGMDEEVSAQAFEPFFTTKSKGKGTGLGLSTVYGIIKQSGGWIGLYSVVGQGTNFHIYLPRLDQRPEPSTTEWEMHPSALKASGTILLAEDEALVRQYAMEILTNHGYTVIESRSPHHALRLLEGHKGPVDVLLTDVVMPGMNGAELAARARTLRPDVHVLYMSGHTGDVLFGNGLLTPDADLLTKPFSPMALLRKLHGVLHADAT
jgi:signal transduction histidine kinase/CheY-like chemotaxis protein